MLVTGVPNALMLSASSHMLIGHQFRFRGLESPSVALSDDFRQSASRSKRRPALFMSTPDVPRSDVGLNGGDVWSGERQSRDEREATVDEACSMVIGAPIVAQYYPGRGWLWRQWRGTIVRRTLPREVLCNSILATVFCLLSCAPSIEPWASLAGHTTAGIARAWTLSATMASFMLSFFLSQSYSLWRSAYSVTRRVQGRCAVEILTSVKNTSAVTWRYDNYTHKCMQYA